MGFLNVLMSKLQPVEQVNQVETVEKGLTPQPILTQENINVTQPRWSDKDMKTSDMIAQYKSWSFVCARLNAESVASANIRLYAITKPNQAKIKNFDTKSVTGRRADNIIKSLRITTPVAQIDEVYDHPALNLLYKVHNFSNYFDHMQMTQTYLDLTGNAYWYIVKDRMGIPVGLYQMRPDITHIVPAKQQLIKGYMYGDKEQVALKTQDVIRFYVPNPSSFYYGKSCIEAGSAEVSRQNLYNQYENSNLQNNARPDFIVRYEGQLTKEDQKTLDYEWNRLYKGTKNAHKIHVMDSNWSIDKLSFSPKEMEFLQGRIYTKKDIASMFGVPYSLLDTSDQLKAGIDDALSYYQRFAIKPRLRRIEETLNEQLIPMFDDSRELYFAFDEVVDEDAVIRKDKNVAYVNSGIISVNEARELEGYDPVPDMDGLRMPVQKVDSATNINNSDLKDKPDNNI